MGRKNVTKKVKHKIKLVKNNWIEVQVTKKKTDDYSGSYRKKQIFEKIRSILLNKIKSRDDSKGLSHINR